MDETKIEEYIVEESPKHEKTHKKKKDKKDKKKSND